MRLAVNEVLGLHAVCPISATTDMQLINHYKGLR